MEKEALTQLFPIIVPRQYGATGRWVGPLRPLGHPMLALTWVVLHSPGSMGYVTHDMVASWERQGIDYHQRSMANLRSATGEYPGTGAKLAADGSALYIVMQHGDGLGSSRLLMETEISDYFPNGYCVGLPERSVGLVVSRTAPDSVLVECKRLVADCAKVGTIPMLPEIFLSDELRFCSDSPNGAQQTAP